MTFEGRFKISSRLSRLGMQKSLVYRSPNLGDLEEIVAINRISLPENYPVGYFIQLIKDWREYSCVAEVDGREVGYAINRIEKSYFSSLFKANSSRGHIISIAVLPEARGQGIGSGMMKVIEKKMRDEGIGNEIILEVRESNTPAIKMYEKLGFFREKVLKGYYRDGESAYKMTIKL